MFWWREDRLVREVCDACVVDGAKFMCYGLLCGECSGVDVG